MGGNNRTWTRNGRNDDHGDSVTRGFRKDNAEGRQRRFPTYRASEQLSDGALIDAMKKVFAGIPGEYHIFDSVFKVENLERGTVVRFCAAAPNSVLSEVRPGHYVPLWQVAKTFHYGNTGNEENLDTLLILKSFLTEPEAAQALEEHNRDQYQDGQQAKLDRLKKLDEELVVQRQAPKLNAIADILTAKCGEIVIDGVTVGLSFGFSNSPGLPPVIITIVNAPEGHPMEEMLGGNGRRPVHVKQRDLSRTDPVDPQASALFQLSAKLRLWVRERMQDAGVEVDKIFAKLATADAPKLNQVIDLVSSWGTWTAPDGVTFFSGHLNYGKAPKTKVIRVVDAPKGHPMEEMLTKKVYVLQQELQYPADDPKLAAITENGKLATQMRGQLRTFLHDADYEFKVRQAIAEPGAAQATDDDGPGVAAERANERAMRAAVHAPSPVAQRAPADLVAHAAIIDAEIAAGNQASAA